MSKFVFINDTHIRTSTPRSRRLPCDFLSECIKDLKYVLEYCRKNNIEYLLHAGDVFDSPNQTAKAVTRLGKLLMEYPEVKFLTCLGNHDIMDRNPTNWVEETSLGIFSELGLIKVLYNGDFEPIFDGQVRVYGFGSDDPYTKDFIEGKKSTKVPTDFFNIALVHYPIGAESSKYSSGTISSVKTNSDWWNLLLFGDIHDFVEIGEHNGFTYCSNGALCKKTLDDIGRDKLFSVFDFKDDFTKMPKHKWEKIPSPPDDVLFELERFGKQEYKEAQAIVASLTRAKERQLEHPREIVQAVGTNAKFSDDVVKLVGDKVTEHYEK